MRAAAGVALLALGWAARGLAGQVPDQPVLRLEVRMHLALIKGIGVDAAGRFLVTGSDDKTVRVWEVATGKQVAVLRPPLGG